MTRRSVAVLGVALAWITAALFAGPAAAQEGEGLIPEGDWSEDQIQQMLDLIDETEAVLPARFPAQATYEELADVLGDLGYFNFGATAPGGYDHWINPGWFFDDHLVDPEFSEALVYQVQDDGTWRLVSAMFMLDPAIDMDSIPEDIAWLPGWHGHPELCVHPDGTFGGITDPDNPSCPEGTSPATTPLMMHVWIIDNGICDHRFGGIGVSGVHCDVGMDHDDDDMDDDHDDDMDDDHDDDMDDDMDGPGTAPPARPVVAQPSFTG
jgi:hypothetical protein